jgi:predicted RNase H-like nuclease (RuvC/YqgF family)
LEARLALVENQKEQELSHLRARAEALETQLSRDASAAQAKISDLEVTIVTNNATIQSLQKELSSVKIQAEIDSRALEVRISHSLEEAATQRNKVEGLRECLH